MDVDIYAHYKNRKPQFENRAFYGTIKYFLLHNYQKKTNMLAYIQWTGPIHKDRYNGRSFSRMGGYEFIEARSINRCVSFYCINKKWYILDIGDNYNIN